MPRSIRKGPFVDLHLAKKVAQMQESRSKKPINTVAEILPQLREGKVTRGRIGVTVSRIPMTQRYAENLGLDKPSGAEITSILTEMGPVESAEDKPADAALDPGATASPAGGAAAPPLPRKRLFKIREGEMWFGVCNGIAAYLGVDVTWVRIAVVVLALVTTGFALVAYFALVFIVPYAETSEDRAAAFGAPFSTA